MNWMLLFVAIPHVIIAFAVAAWGLFVAVALARCALALEEMNKRKGGGA